MTRSAKTISALLLVAATTGTALAAGVSAPSLGSRDFDTSRAAPLNLPAFSSKPTPVVDGDTIARAFGEGSVDNYATVTLNHDGSIEETPPSESLRALVQLMLANSGA
ncbi:MAG: hypothetical protein ABL866_06535 [Devosia sp.]